MTFDPTSVEVTCVTLRKDHCVQVLWKYIKVCGYSDPFCKNLNQRSLTPRWPLTPHLLRSYVWLYPRIIVSKSHENTSKYVDTVTFFAKKNLNQRSLTPRWPLTPHLLRSHVWLYPRIIVSKSHENTSKYVDTVTFFAKKNLNQRSLTPRWPLTPHLLRSHVWLYPRIILSKSHENTSKYVDTVNLFAKTWTKGHWPLDDLWPHICWGHMCDCAQGSLCPSPMGIRQCMWIQWWILQITTYIHTHTTYILRTYYILHTTYYVQNQWSHSLSQARQKHIGIIWAMDERRFKISINRSFCERKHMIILVECASILLCTMQAWKLQAIIIIIICIILASKLTSTFHTLLSYHQFK